MNIKSKDLNLLRVFAVLSEELNVSRAARRLALSQPAVSNALARLRADFGDELFVRSGKGVVPTPRAMALKSEVAAVMAAAAELYDKIAFDPASLDGRFTMATTDYFEHLLVPRLLPYLGRRAPRLTTVFRPTAGVFPKAELESGQLDLAVAGFFGELPEGFYQRVLLTETYACVVRRNHPKAGRALTLKTYLELEHLLVSPQGDLNGAVDRALAERGLKRRVVAGLANFHTPAAIVAGSDYVVTVPARIAAAYASVLPVVCHPPPLPVPGFRLVQVWHARTHRDPRHVWLRDAIEEVLTGV